ncbi:MAG: hypothetical protein ABI700_32105, partial [Chloroflexota bacterium]
MKKIALILLLVIISTVPAYAQQQPQTGADLVAYDLFNKGSDLLTAQNYDQAVLDLSLFILVNPTYTLGYFARAQGYMALSKFDNALQDVDHAIATVPSSASADYGAALYSMRAEIEGQQKNADGALKDYSQSITIKPTMTALASRGLIYLGQSNYQSALTDLNDAITLDSSNPVLFVYRGAANAGLHNPTGTAADYLDFFNAISPNPTIHDPIQSGQVVTLQVDQGVVTVLPFAAKANQYISALAVARSGSVDPLLALIDSKGTALAGDDDGGGNSNALILNYQVAADGNYG